MVSANDNHPLPIHLRNAPVWYIEWQDWDAYVAAWALTHAPDHEAAFQECAERGTPLEVRLATEKEYEQWVATKKLAAYAKS